MRVSALQQFTGEYDRRGRPVPGFLVLRLGDLDQHLRGRVLDVHLLQDGDPVVRDDDVAHRID